MPVTRRNFLKIAIGLLGMAAAGGITLFEYTRRIPLFKKRSNSIRSFCPFCSLNCAVKIYYTDTKITSVQPEKKSFESNGRICPKAHMLREMFNRPDIISFPLVREAGSDVFLKTDYSDVLNRCAETINRTREETFITESSGFKINSFSGAAVIAGDKIGCEDAYVINKFSRVIGISRVGSGALIRHNSSVMALCSTFGIAAQHNPVYDIVNSDVVFIIGANPARTNTMQLCSIQEARKRGATIIVADPIAGETAALADIYLPLLPGTDTILLCGLIRYLLHNNRYDAEYLRDNTDASFLVNESFLVNADGTFSGYNAESAYDTLTWSYIIDERGNPRTDSSMKKINCVFQILKKSYSAYTPDNVLNMTGLGADLFLKAAETLASVSLPAKSCSVIFGGGFTQSSGGQGVRAVSILQLLCGNTGIAGGGIYGINDRSNQQGVSDQIGNWNCLPGYLPIPDSSKMENDYESYIKNNSKKSNDFSVSNYWNNFQGYFESQMRCWFKSISPEKAFSILPRGSSNYSFSKLLDDVGKGSIKGLIVFDEDIFAAPVSENRIINALNKLSWIIMFVSNQNRLSRLIGKLSFSKNASVILVPLPSYINSEMHFVSSDRRFNAYDGSAVFKRGAAMYPQIAFALQGIAKKIAEIHKANGGVFSDPIIDSEWRYSTIKSIAKELGGVNRANGSSDNNIEQVFSESYVCGNWLYSDIIGDKRLLKRDKYSQNGLLRDTDRCWPSGEQVLFNRAGVNFKDGSPRHGKCIVFEDVKKIKNEELARKRPFRFTRDGVAYLFAREMISGPLPISGLEIKDDNNDFLLFTSSWSESSFAEMFNYYNEYYPEDCILMNRESAVTAGFENGKNVVVQSSVAKITVPLYITERIANKRAVNGIGVVFKELLDNIDSDIITPVTVRIYKEISNGR
ncbi:MAG TPA: molybdopterin-dependent oxidoreductase [Spirochaetota bacterium]|nr:molybdopterin-dependent oxidoreductase [Spirochaetota bacterium]